MFCQCCLTKPRYNRYAAQRWRIVHIRASVTKVYAINPAMPRELHIEQIRHVSKNLAMDRISRSFFELKRAGCNQIRSSYSSIDRDHNSHSTEFDISFATICAHPQSVALFVSVSIQYFHNEDYSPYSHAAHGHQPRTLHQPYSHLRGHSDESG